MTSLRLIAPPKPQPFEFIIQMKSSLFRTTLGFLAATILPISPANTATAPAKKSNILVNLAFAHASIFVDLETQTTPINLKP